MIAAVLSGFVVAALLLLTGKFLKGKFSLLAFLPAAIFAFFLSCLPDVSAGKVLLYHYKWIPALGVNLRFRLDGLSMLFAMLISGMGVLVFIYASGYLRRKAHRSRFFGWLSVFMASMLGLVLADNVLLLFVFWEVTSISSYFLIGFDNKSAEARKSALMALSVTGAGGFFLLAGLVLMAGIYDSYAIEAMLTSKVVLEKNAAYPLLIFLIFAGAFTKSAQFPFHFWLPRAMAAPTPVSAYLHSATMVKAGIYLLARFTPLFDSGFLWQPLLLITGGVTMLFGGVHAALRTDLKAILAYSTVSALGILVFLLGIGTEIAYVACVVFIIAHAFYKASLFFIAGGLDHGAGTRDITRLAGLGKALLPLAVAGVFAAFSGAGIPFTFGFIGKELFYEATLTSADVVLRTTVAVITNSLMFVAVFLVGVKPFIGRRSAALGSVQPPPVPVWLPALVLAMAGLAVGIFPQWMTRVIVNPAVASLHGELSEVSIGGWHGFTMVLALSGVTLALGAVLFVLIRPSAENRNRIARFDAVAPEHLLAVGSQYFERFSLWYSRTLQNGYLRSYVITTIVFLVCIVAYIFFTEVNIYMTERQWAEISVYEGLVFVLMVGAIFMTLNTNSRLTAILAMSVVGYCLCLFFVLFSAPDLAMTQFAIDTLTIVLFVLVLLRLPPFIRHTKSRLKVRDGFVSVLFGSLVAIIALQVLNEPTNKMVSRFYADNAYLEAKGRNVVNVILVDFRGFDTLVEITVLAIAAIGVYSLLKLNVWRSEKE